MNDAEKLAYLQKNVAAMLKGAYYVTVWGSGKSQITLDKDGSEAFLKLRVLEACNELGPSEPLPSHLQEMADQGREVMQRHSDHLLKDRGPKSLLFGKDQDEPEVEPGACGDPECPVLHADPANPIHPPSYEPPVMSAGTAVYRIYGPEGWDEPDAYLGYFEGTWEDLMEELGSGNLARLYDEMLGHTRIMVRDRDRVNTSRLRRD